MTSLTVVVARQGVEAAGLQALGVTAGAARDRECDAPSVGRTGFRRATPCRSRTPLAGSQPGNLSRSTTLTRVAAAKLWRCRSRPPAGATRRAGPDNPARCSRLRRRSSAAEHRVGAHHGPQHGARHRGAARGHLRHTVERRAWHAGTRAVVVREKSPGCQPVEYCQFFFSSASSAVDGCAARWLPRASSTTTSRRLDEVIGFLRALLDAVGQPLAGPQL